MRGASELDTLNRKGFTDERIKIVEIGDDHVPAKMARGGFA